MNSDLTFITNENNQNLKKRFEVLIKDTKLFDCLVGYFYASGFHVLEELKKEDKTKDIPVVILTNLDEKTQGNVERAKELGAVDYWVKAHFQPAEIIEKVKVLLHK